MERIDLFKLHENLCNTGRELMAAKNKDYGSNTDPFANFRMAALLHMRPELGVLLRLQDKMARLVSFIEKGDLAVKEESWKDAIIDIINYSVILCGLLQESVEKESVACGEESSAEFWKKRALDMKDGILQILKHKLAGSAEEFLTNLVDKKNIWDDEMRQKLFEKNEETRLPGKYTPKEAIDWKQRAGELESGIKQALDEYSPTSMQNILMKLVAVPTEISQKAQITAEDARKFSEFSAGIINQAMKINDNTR